MPNVIPYFGLITDEFGLEPELFTDADRAGARAQELMRLAAYRCHAVRVINLDITIT
jgi:hypothetical protein